MVRMKARTATVHRRTSETDIRLRLNLDGRGRYSVSTGIRFLDHMLELFARHGGFDLELQARGDLDVDQHHTVEDVGIVLGQAVRRALGSKKGINPAADFILPMDENLALAALDLSGRPYLVLRAPLKTRRGGGPPTGVVGKFFPGLSTHARAEVPL